MSHASLQQRAPCPVEDSTGRVYVQAQPKVLVRVAGMAPLQATVWELERLRCKLCGTIVTAEAPEELGTEKYDASSSTLIGMLRYGSGLPFNRLQRPEQSLGIPLPASTQWDVVRDAADSLAPVWAELIRQAARGRVLHNTAGDFESIVANGNAHARRKQDGSRSRWPTTSPRSAATSSRPCARSAATMPRHAARR